MNKILITGFEPWGEHGGNSSWNAVEQAQPSLSSDWQLNKQRLPVSWKRIHSEIKKIVQQKYDIIVLFGMSPNPLIQIERIAINLTSRHDKDVDQLPPPGNFVQEHGPAAYWSQFDVEQVNKRLNDSALPSDVSAHAGTFLCNYSFYLLMHQLNKSSPNCLAGFIHVPSFAQESPHSPKSLSQAVELIVNELTIEFDRQDH